MFRQSPQPLQTVHAAQQMMIKDDVPDVFDQANGIAQSLLALRSAQLGAVQRRTSGENGCRPPLDDVVHGAIVQELNVGGMYEHTAVTRDSGHHDRATTTFASAMRIKGRKGDVPQIQPLRHAQFKSEYAHERVETRAHAGRKRGRGWTPAAPRARGLREMADIQLVGIGVCQGDVVTVKMADDNVRRRFELSQDPPSDRDSHGDLQRMRQQSVADVAKGYAGIDDDAPPRRFDHATQAANPQGFRAEYVDSHTHGQAPPYCPMFRLTGLERPRSIFDHEIPLSCQRKN